MEALVSPINVSWAAWIWHFLYIFTFSLHFRYIFYIFFTFSLHFSKVRFTFFYIFFTFSAQLGGLAPPQTPLLNRGASPPGPPDLNYTKHESVNRSKWCPNDVQMMSKWCPNDAQMMSKWCPDDVQMMPRWCPNLVQNGTCTMAIVHVLWP